MMLTRDEVIACLSRDFQGKDNDDLNIQVFTLGIEHNNTTDTDIIDYPFVYLIFFFLCNGLVMLGKKDETSIHAKANSAIFV